MDWNGAILESGQLIVVGALFCGACMPRGLWGWRKWDSFKDVEFTELGDCLRRWKQPFRDDCRVVWTGPQSPSLRHAHYHQVCFLVMMIATACRVLCSISCIWDTFFVHFSFTTTAFWDSSFYSLNVETTLILKEPDIYWVLIMCSAVFKVLYVY